MKSLFASLLVLCAALLGGCRSTPPPGAVRVGVMLPLSGSYRHYGEQLRDGMDFALEKINAERQKDGQPPLWLDIEDTASDAKTALKRYRALVSRGVPVVIGPGATDEALLLMRPADEARVPLVMPVATGDALTRSDDYVLRSCFSDDYQARRIAEYLKDDLQVERLAVFIDLDKGGLYGRNMARRVSEHFQELGGTVVRTEGFRNEDLNFTRQLDAVTAARPQALFVPALADAALRILRQARLLGFSGWFVGGDAMAERDFLSQLDRDSGKIVFASQFSPYFESEAVAGFVKAMEFRTGRPPGDCEAQGYDTLMLVNHLLTGLPPGVDFLSAWNAGSDFNFLTGPFKLNADGDAVRPVFLHQVEIRPDAPPVITAKCCTEGND